MQAGNLLKNPPVLQSEKSDKQNTNKNKYRK